MEDTKLNGIIEVKVKLYLETDVDDVEAEEIIDRLEIKHDPMISHVEIERSE